MSTLVAHPSSSDAGQIRALASDTQESHLPRIAYANLLPRGDLEACIGSLVEYHNHQRYHEGMKNLTSADVYFGRGQTILLKRESIKRAAIQNRRLQVRKKAV